MAATCKSSDASGKDYNTLDCTAYPGYDAQSACWSSSPPTGASRTVQCYSVDAVGNLSVELDTTKCTGTAANAVPVYLIDTSVTTVPTVPTAQCANTGTASLPAGGCVFADSADEFSAVASSETCTGCTTCPTTKTYAIGVGVFSFTSS